MAEKPKKRPESQPTFNISGEIEGGIINIGGEQNFNAPIIVNLRSNLDQSIQSIKANPSTDSETKKELVALTGQLKELLEGTPPGSEEMAELVAKRLKVLMDEANTQKPDREIMQVTADGLKKAAQNLASVLPSVLPVCTSIVKILLGS